MRHLGFHIFYLWLALAIVGGCGGGEMSVSTTGSGSDSGTGSESPVVIPLITVSAAYTNAPNWNDYVRGPSPTESATACDGTENGTTVTCVHGGEVRKVTTTETTCSGLSMSDELGAFDWSCSVASGVAVFTSALKSGKGAQDLIDASTPSWRSNRVTLSGGSGGQSVSSSWWSNTVTALPNNAVTCSTGSYNTCSGNVAVLDSAGTIYVLGANGSSKGYNLNASKVGIVLASGVTLTNVPAGSNCALASGNVAAPSSVILLCAGSENFLWIEGGTLNGVTTASTNYGIYFHTVKFSYIRNMYARETAIGLRLVGSSFNRVTQYKSTTTTAGATGLMLTNASHYNTLQQLELGNAVGTGISVDSSNYNVFKNFRLGDAGMSILLASYNKFAEGNVANSSGDGIIYNNSTYNVLSRVVFSGIESYGVYNQNNSIANIASAISLLHSSDGAFGGLYSANSSANNIFHNAVIGNHGGIPYGANGGFNTTLTQIAYANAASAPSFIVGATATTGGNMLTPNLSSAFVARVQAPGDDANTTDGAVGAGTGTAVYNGANDWLNFDNFFRAWSIASGTGYGDTLARGSCLSNNCQIWDWSLSAANSVIRGTTGNGATQNGTPSASACPTESYGNQTLNSGTFTQLAANIYAQNGVETGGGDGDTICETGETCRQTYLKSAVEIIGDSIGDDDGLCESNESCLYTPNFGAYQGHGTLTQCAWSQNGGSISGVTMYYYPTNGR